MRVLFRMTSMLSLLLFASWVAIGWSAETDRGFEGHWEGAIMSLPGVMEADLVIELQKVGTQWTGEVALPTIDLEHYPLKNITVSGGQISFMFEDQDGARYFTDGRLEENGRVLKGYFKRRQEVMTFELDRKGAPGKGAGILREGPELHMLSASAAELRQAFNKDVGKVRLVTLLSPACAQCIAHARIAWRTVLNKVDDPRLRVYAVWQPIHGDDTLAAARSATVSLPDPRVTHFWAGDVNLAKAFREPLGYGDELVWDVFLVYPAQAQWQTTPPRPAFFMYGQNGLPLPREQKFHGLELAEAVRRQLAGAESKAK